METSIALAVIVGVLFAFTLPALLSRVDTAARRVELDEVPEAAEECTVTAHGSCTRPAEGPGLYTGPSASEHCAPAVVLPMTAAPPELHLSRATPEFAVIDGSVEAQTDETRMVGARTVEARTTEPRMDEAGEILIDGRIGIAHDDAEDVLPMAVGQSARIVVESQTAQSGVVVPMGAAASMGAAVRRGAAAHAGAGSQPSASQITTDRMDPRMNSTHSADPRGNDRPMPGRTELPAHLKARAARPPRNASGARGSASGSRGTVSGARVDGATAAGRMDSRTADSPTEEQVEAASRIRSLKRFIPMVSIFFLLSVLATLVTVVLAPFGVVPWAAPALTAVLAVGAICVVRTLNLQVRRLRRESRASAHGEEHSEARTAVGAKAPATARAEARASGRAEAKSVGRTEARTEARAKVGDAAVPVGSGIQMNSPRHRAAARDSSSRQAWSAPASAGTKESSRAAERPQTASSAGDSGAEQSRTSTVDLSAIRAAFAAAERAEVERATSERTDDGRSEEERADEIAPTEKERAENERVAERRTVLVRDGLNRPADDADTVADTSAAAVSDASADAGTSAEASAAAADISGMSADSVQASESTVLPDHAPDFAVTVAHGRRGPVLSLGGDLDGNAAEKSESGESSAAAWETSAGAEDRAQKAAGTAFTASDSAADEPEKSSVEREAATSNDPLARRFAATGWLPAPLPKPTYVEAPVVERAQPAVTEPDASSFRLEPQSKENLAEVFAAELGYRPELEDSARSTAEGSSATDSDHESAVEFGYGPLAHGRAAIGGRRGVGRIDDALARRRA